MDYVRIEEVIDFHDLLVEKYGGLSGIRDLGLLTSALAMPKQSYLVPHLLNFGNLGGVSLSYRQKLPLF